MGHLPYFAYGSNLNRVAMSARCPDCRPIGPATLADWALTFRGVADIEPLAGARAHGAIWTVSDRDLANLDRYEGYPSLYRRELVSVRVDAAEVVAIRPPAPLRLAWRVGVQASSAAWAILNCGFVKGTRP